MNEENAPTINLKGHLLTVGESGVNIEYSNKNIYLVSGSLTSSAKNLVINSKTFGSEARDVYGDMIILSPALDVSVRDHKTHKIGLVVSGKRERGEYGLIGLAGAQENTFTGDVIVDGVRNILYLKKEDGVTAVRGNIHLRNQGGLRLFGSDQISDSSTITLSGKGSSISFATTERNLKEKVHALVIESGQGVLAFGRNGRFPDNDSLKRTLILDDLIISDEASLRIMRWKEGRDHLLVRKDSVHLADAMKKILIDGWAKNQIYLKDYNKNYWSIEAAPEPAVCGAVLGTVGLGLWRWRRRRWRNGT